MAHLMPEAGGCEKLPGVDVGAGFSGGHAPGTKGRRVSAGSWSAYAATAVAFVFAGVTFYWAAGGMAGVRTLGGFIEKMATARDAAFVAVLWATGVLKVAGGVLAVALIGRGARKVPRLWLLRAAWGAAALLVLYGGAQTASVALVRFGVVTPAEPVASSVLWWRLLLWEPWFLVWGVLLGLAARNAGRRWESG